ncbi:hypothetical protein IWQ60_010469 [Tieghemiomyces parasiticus]|uniref:Major facilitator superfamily (MFS) profile domain-containing protein n=1 Tax=Tieghemiomyces parasiticus TaxID=78921 RepID=A0A9W8DNI7_9FUNG|nr:hypothetical protein IWQ60_010469 [Tieghemiomyces parasiticus]
MRQPPCDASACPRLGQFHRAWVASLHAFFGSQDRVTPSSRDSLESNGFTGFSLIGMATPDLKSDSLTLSPTPRATGPVYCPFSELTKAVILTITALAGMLAPLASNIVLPALPMIGHGLKTDAHQTSLAISFFMVGMAFGPLLWGPLADTYGRRYAYALGTFACVLASIACALATNVQWLIATRFLQALGGSVTMVVGAGTISDIYEAQGRGRAMGLYFSGQMLGPVLGTVGGGYIAQNWGWRAVFWVTSIVAGVSFILLTFALPETHRPTVARRFNMPLKGLPPPGPGDGLGSRMEKGLVVGVPAKQALSLTSLNHRRPRVVNPFAIFRALRHPYVLLPVLCTAFFFGTFYAMKTVIPIVLTTIYGLSASQTGLCFLSIGLGNIVGSVLGGYITDFTMNRRVRLERTGPVNGEVLSLPIETRLQLLLFTTVMFPITLTAYGWLIDTHAAIPVLMVLQFFRKSPRPENSVNVAVAISPGRT